MKLNKFQAAKAVGISRTTLDRHLDEGKLTAERDGRGRVVIDVAELHRVYEQVNMDALSQNAASEQNDTSSQDSDLSYEVKVRDEKIEGLQQQLTLLKDERDDLRRRLDQEAEERRKLTLMLTDQRPQTPPPAHTEPQPPAEPTPLARPWLVVLLIAVAMLAGAFFFLKDYVW